MLRRGLTLMEILIALGLVAFALLTMVGVCIRGTHLMTRGERITIATDVGREVLESLKQQGYAALPAADSLFDGRVPDPADASGFPGPPYPSSRSCNLVIRTEKLDTELKSVTVTVYYDGTSHVEFQTYLRP